MILLVVNWFLRRQEDVARTFALYCNAGGWQTSIFSQVYFHFGGSFGHDESAWHWPVAFCQGEMVLASATHSQLTLKF